MNILYAEDHALVRKSTARLLESLGWMVTSVENGLLAVECLKRGEQFDLIVSDIMMPELTGVQLANFVAKEHPQLPVLLVSGNPEELELFRGELPQHMQLLMKPFSTKELSASLSNLITQARGNKGSQ